MTSDDGTVDKQPVTAAARLAQEIRRRREAADLSQARLAAVIGYSPQYVSLAERPKGLASAELVRAIDVALDAGDALIMLRLEAVAERQRLHRGGAVAATNPVLGETESPTDDQDDVVRVAIGKLRRVLGAKDLPGDGPVRHLAALEHAVNKMLENRLEARYVQIAEHLPELLAELLRAKDTCTTSERHQIARMMTSACRTADGIAFKFGYTDLSDRVIDLMQYTAEATDDVLLLASVAYVRTESFFTTGDLDTGARALVHAADSIPKDTMGQAPAAATYGSLHMRAAVVAARSGKADLAYDHLAEARRAATLTHEGVYFGTAFGPSSVKIHDVAVAVELGDSPSAVAAGRDWHPPRQIPAERRSHFYIDLASAQVQVGRNDDAYTALRTARQIAPQHTRQHPRVRKSLSTLLLSRLGNDEDLVNFANWVQLTPS